MYQYKTILAVFLCACLLTIHQQADAQADPNYYNSVNESSPAALRNSLHAIIDDHTRIPYTSSSTDTWDVLELAGENVDNFNQVITLYKNSANTKVGGGNNTYNREHSWPKSYGFPDDGSSNYPYTDMHHLFISDSSYNSFRGNKPFDICVSGCDEKVTQVNNNRGGNGQSNFTLSDLWNVWSGRQGDIARAMFYMDVRYAGGTHGNTGVNEPDLILTDNLNLINASATGDNEPVAYMGLLSVLLVWHQNDAVDIYEHQHNEAVAAAQGNRNPFIDNPDWVTCVFELVCDGGGSDSTPPAAVTNLTASANNQSIYVDWYNNSETDLAGYTIYRSVNNSNNFNPLNANLLTYSNYSDADVSAGNTYYYYVTADDNAGNESIKGATTSATVAGGSNNTLTNGVAKTGLSGSTNNQQFYTIDVPAGANSLDFNLSGGLGDADLYVRFGSQPNLSSYDCRPWLTGNNESCAISVVQAGTYHVMINAYSAYSDVSLVASFATSQQTIFINNANINIPDNNPNGATSSINASLSGQAGNVAISYNIVHTYRGDLRVQLISPNGSVTTLRDPSGGGTDNLNETINSNQGSQNATGTWQLKVVDIYNQDTGYINSWQIEFL